jgi:type IV pilus assembly protein PilA
MNIQKKAQKGFTLIELMIVIAIVGILAAIALPAYQDYIVRSKLSESLAAMAEAKTTIAEYYAANGDFPTDPATFGINTANRGVTSEYLEYLDITPSSIPTSGVAAVYIVANVPTCVWSGGCTTASDSSTAAFALSGSTNADGTMSWSCIPGDGPGSETAIETKYLPANCRG